MKYYIGNNLLSYSGYTDATIEDCFAYCASKPVLGLDIETKRKYKKNLYPEKNYKPGLDPYLSEICMLQIGDLENQFVIDARVISLAFLAPILENPDILKVGHNLKFEGSHLYINYNISLINVWDTMICERILYNGLPLSFSLEALSYRYLDSSKKITQTELFTETENELDYLIEPTEDAIIDWMDSNFTFVIDKSIRLDFVEIDDKPFTQKQLDYACDDILMPLLIYSKQKDGRYAGDSFYYPEKGFKIENAFTQVLAKVELKGVKVNTEGWKALYDKNFKKRYEIKTILDKFVEQHYPQFAGQYNLFDNSTTCQIEWESSTQVVKFFKFLQICPKEYSKQTKRVDYTVSAKALFKLLTNENKDLFYKEKLQEFSSKDDFQSLFINYLIYKKYQLLTTTFGLEWLNWIHPMTKRVHTTIKQLLNTGRMASNSPNLQQLPKGKEWRELFIADEGFDLAAVDYDTQEVKVAAIAHKEPLLQDFFVSHHPVFGSDFHSFTASKIFSIIRRDPNLVLNKDDHKKERNIAKSMTFKLFYGATAYTISQDLGISVEEAEEFIEAYMVAFPGLKEAFEHAKTQAVARGWVDICLYTGKRYFFPEFDEMNKLNEEFLKHFDSSYKRLSTAQRQVFKQALYENNPNLITIRQQAGKLKGKLERIALNYIIQGSSSVMMKIAMILIEQQTTNLKTGVLLTIHDEVVTQYPTELIEEKCKFVETSMAKAGEFFTKDLKMSATGAIGKTWIH